MDHGELEKGKFIQQQCLFKLQDLNELCLQSNKSGVTDSKYFKFSGETPKNQD